MTSHIISMRCSNICYFLTTKTKLNSTTAQHKNNDLWLKIQIKLQKHKTRSKYCRQSPLGPERYSSIHRLPLTKRRYFQNPA